MVETFSLLWTRAKSTQCLFGIGREENEEVKSLKQSNEKASLLSLFYEKNFTDLTIIF